MLGVSLVMIQNDVLWRSMMHEATDLGEVLGVALVMTQYDAL